MSIQIDISTQLRMDDLVYAVLSRCSIEVVENNFQWQNELDLVANHRPDSSGHGEVNRNR